MGRRKLLHSMSYGHYEKFEETRLKAKSDVGSNEQTQAYVAIVKMKGKFGKSCPQKRKKNMEKVQFYGYGHYKILFPKLKKDDNKRGRKKSHITEEVEEAKKKKSKK